MADRPEMFGPTRGFSIMRPELMAFVIYFVWAYQGVFGDDRFNGNMQNILGPILVAMATKFWLGAETHSPDAHRLVCLLVCQHDNC